MGITYVNITVARSAESRKKRKARCLVDTGAELTVLPATLLREIGVRPHDEEEFGLADGTVIHRKLGRVFVEFQGRREYTPVVFGQEGDASLLGTLTLEELRFWIDPLRRELRPLKLHLRSLGT